MLKRPPPGGKTTCPPETPSIRGRFPSAREGALRIAAGTLYAVLSFGLATAVAVPCRAEDDATLAMARERFREGVQYFDQELYDKARAAFLQAYALRPHPVVLLNLAQSELRSGYEADAAKHFAEVLRERGSVSEGERRIAETGLASAKTVVAEIALSVDEDGAEIVVDGNREGLSPLPGPIYLAPGTHTITARKGDREDSVELTVRAGQSGTTTLRLAATTSPGRQTQRSSPAAEPATRAVPESPGAMLPPDDEDEDEPRRQGFFAWAASSPAAWIGGGLTLAGIAGGIGFGLAAKSNYDSADSVIRRIREEAAKDGIPTTTGLCLDPRTALDGATMLTIDPDTRASHYEHACAIVRDNTDTGDSYRTLAIVSGAVAGVAAVGTVVLYLVERPTSTADASARRGPTARLVPWLGPGERGLSIVGEF